MRDLYLLDPHTWVSSVPTDISARLKDEADRTEACLTAVGRQRWLQALSDEGIRLPKFRNQPAFRAFLAEAMDDDRIVLLAITFTRIEIAFYLRERSAGLAPSVRGRNPVDELQSLAMSATKTLFHWQWIVPFDEEGRFDFELWEHPNNVYF